MWSMRISASVPAVRSRRGGVAARHMWWRIIGASPSPLRGWPSATDVRSNSERVGASFVRSGGPRVGTPPIRSWHGGASTMHFRRIGAAGPQRLPRAGVSAATVLSGCGDAHAMCLTRNLAPLAHARFLEAAPAGRSAGSAAAYGACGWCAAPLRGTPGAYRSDRSNVLRATRGREADRSSRIPVKPILRGFVTHRACRLSARPCILNGIDAPSPDGRNRSTTRGVEV